MVFRTVCRLCAATVSTVDKVVPKRKLSEQFSSVDLVYQLFGPLHSSLLPPLVLLHGLFGHKRNFQSIAKAVERRLKSQVLTVDLRNHGVSPWAHEMSRYQMAADVERLIETQILPALNNSTGKINLLGHSMGGGVAMVLAGSRADLIENLIIEDVSPKSHKERAATSAIPTYIEAMLNLDLDIRNFHSLSEAKRIADEELKKVITDTPTRLFLLTNLIEQNGFYGWKMNLEAIGENLNDILGPYPDKDKFEIFQGPTLVIKGSKSTYVTAGDQPAFRQRFSNVKFETIDDAGHWVHADQPQDFVDSIINFISNGK